ncbi:MAG: hypothetical protein P4M05_05280 [Bradyrhizobium sp.]|nr:hypothetical protein [Bradyrhizobium sp.]
MSAIPFGILAVVFLTAIILAFVLDAMKSVLFRQGAMSDIGKRYGDRQTAVQADRARQKAPGDVIEQLRDEAQFLSERSADRKTLADAAQPLYAGLDDQQKRRFAKELGQRESLAGSAIEMGALTQKVD